MPPYDTRPIKGLSDFQGLENTTWKNPVNKIHLDPETILSLTPHYIFKFQNVNKRMQTCTSMSTLLRKGSQTAMSCVEDMRFSNGDATFFSPKNQQNRVHFFNAWTYTNGIKNQAFSFSSISNKALISSLIETVSVFRCQTSTNPLNLDFINHYTKHLI